MYTKTLRGYVLTKKTPESQTPKLIIDPDSSNSPLSKPIQCPQFSVARINLLTQLRTQSFMFNSLLLRQRDKRAKIKGFVEDVTDDLNCKHV